MTSTKPAARAAILASWAVWRQSHPCPAITNAAKEFSAAYTASNIACEPWVREAYPRLTFGALYRWLQQPKTGPVMLQTLPRRRDKPSAFDAEPLRGALLALRARHPRVAAATLHSLLRQALPGEPIPTVRSLCRYLQRERDRHPQRELLLRNPDAWRSAYLSAAGSYSQEATHPNALWETDTTLGDVDLRHAGGTCRHSIIGLIDVFSRRALFLVTRHSKTSAVLSLLRRGMFAWGMPAAVKTDQGAEFTSQHFQLAMLSLGIEHRPCAPFSPQQKPHIERVFGTLTRQLFELLPGYVGHSVAERKELEARRSFAQRLRDGEPPALLMTAGELQKAIDQWVQRYEATEHSSLNGKSPQQVFADAGPVQPADERALDALLLPVSNEGARTVTKKGVLVAGSTYNHAELGGLEGRQVLCFMDEADATSLYVYDSDGAFVCKAIDLAAAPAMATDIAMQRRRRQMKMVSQFKDETKAAAERFDASAAVRGLHGLEAPQAASVVPLSSARSQPTAPAEEPGADARAVQRAQSVLADLFPELLKQSGGPA